MRAYSLRWKQGSRTVQQFRNFRPLRLLIPYHKQIHDSHRRPGLPFVTNWHLFPITQVCSSEHLNTVRFSVSYGPSSSSEKTKLRLLVYVKPLTALLTLGKHIAPPTPLTESLSLVLTFFLCFLDALFISQAPHPSCVLRIFNFIGFFLKIVRKHCQISSSHKFTKYIPTEPLCDYVGIHLPLSILYTFIWFLYIPLSTSPQPTWPPSRILLVKPNATELKN